MDYKYTSIDEAKRGHWWLWKREIITAILITTVLNMATFGIILLISIHVPKFYDLTCGKTFEEAHQHGCIFDPLTLTWLRPECSQYGQQEFIEAAGSSNGTWRYWEDETGLLEIPNYEALSYLPPGSAYWTTQEQHLHHCMWMLLRVHDALHHGKRLDSRSTSYDHSKHCLSMMVEQAKVGVGENLRRLNVVGHAGDVGWNVC